MIQIQDVQKKIFDFFHKDAIAAVVKAIIAWESSQPVANALTAARVKIDYAKHDQFIFMILIWVVHRISSLYEDSKKNEIVPPAREITTTETIEK